MPASAATEAKEIKTKWLKIKGHQALPSDVVDPLFVELQRFLFYFAIKEV